MRASTRQRVVVALSTIGLLAALLPTPATTPSSAATFERDPHGDLKTASAAACPTIDRPPPMDAWFNITDLEQRGRSDPGQEPWDFAKKIAQVVCGAAPKSEIKIGMYFTRALGTMTATGLGPKPEADAEVIYAALEWVHANRGVTIGLVQDSSSSSTDESRVTRRLGRIAKLYWCTNGCFNTNPATVFPSAVIHEKFLTISDTVWDDDGGSHPMVLSMSGNFARSQVRNYSQELTALYGDKKMLDLFEARFDGMAHCAKTGCRTASGFPSGLRLTKQRNIWVDPIYRHYTDAGRGTSVSFSPQSQGARDFYIQQFDDVDCAVDPKIRIAMYKLTDAKALSMVNALVRLRDRGCDIKMLLTSPGGSAAISASAAKLLRTARIPTRCTTTAMHTKLILIGPAHGNSGRSLSGTQNMSVSGLRYNEEHVITMDTRRASAAYREPMRRVYGEYLDGWYELSLQTRACPT
jgi:hypothetical protein